MFNKSALTLVALTLATSAVANSNTTIPLRRTSSDSTLLTRADGVFDKDRAIVDAVRTQNKHRQNLINLSKNRALPVGAVIKPLATVPRAIQRRMWKRKRQAEALIDQGEYEWTGAIAIGTPAQKFQIDFDTGSADLWVVSAGCTSSNCAAHSKFSTSASSTAHQQSGKFSIAYGDGSTVSGPVYTDTVSIAGVTVAAQYFSPVTTLSSSFAQDAADGILGLAFPAISNLGHPPFFNAAAAQHAVAANQFGFFLAGSGSELFLGGVDGSKFRGAVEYHGVDTATGFWEIAGGSVKVGATTVVKGMEAIIDSGTTIMYGPPKLVAAIYARVPGAKVWDAANGYYSFPCASPPQISFAWGGRAWAVSAQNINLGLTATGSSRCVGALAGKDFGFGANVFLLGDAFMRNAYVVFDAAKPAVGLAQLA
ncbi:acid protease [Mycena filopes]|nr:acid protease [Mycena filopes]